MSESREDMLRLLAAAQQSVKSRQAAAATIAGNSGDAPPSSTPDTLGHGAGLRGARKAQAASSTLLNAKDNLTEFITYYYSVLSKFCAGPSYELRLPDLDGQGRRVLHTLAEECNLSHASSEAKGTGRTLVLTKDTLFYRNQSAYQRIDLANVAAKVSGKESKFHVRRVHAIDPASVATGALGSYGDEDALRKIERFQRATDEYRHAVEVGYTQEEALAMASTADGGRVEDILRRPIEADNIVLLASSGDGASSPPTTEAKLGTTTATPVALESVEKVYEEVCRGCATHVTLDYPVSKWRCSKYCAQCTRLTIWSLEEKTGLILTPRRNPVQGPAGVRKHPRGGDDLILSPQLTAARTPEEIDKDSDDEGSSQVEDEAPLTVEDIVESAAMNDFSAEDTNWLRRFATDRATHLQGSVTFCIQFQDLMSMPLFRRYDGKVRGQADRGCDEGPERKRARSDATSPCLYVVVRQSNDLQRSLSSLVEEVTQAGVKPVTCPGVEAKAPLNHVGLAFLNVSVYGSEATALCQLRPQVDGGKADIDRAALAALQQRYGTRHCYVTDSLADAIDHAMA